MKSIFRLGLLFCFFQAYSQVGINTTAPNAQLEIKASNSATPSNSDGIIIPRVDAFPATNPTASQQGMMVYLTTTSGSNAPGFYYWDNATTSWVGIVSTANGDKDWYKASTTTTPSNTDNMYHMGNVGIGNSNPQFPLDFATTLGDKISFWGIPTNHYGFGLQSNLFQIHSDFNFSDIAFGYGSSGAFTENVRFKGNGFVGIGNSNPTVPLQFGWSTGDKVSFFGNAAAYHGIGIQDYLMQIHGGIAADDIAFGYGSSASMTEVMRIKGTGQVGIGTTTPAFPLSFGPALGDKIALYGASGSHFGLGVQTSLFQIHGSNSGDDIVFGYGSSASFTEKVRIKGTGNVGIGNTTPNFPLSFASSVGDKISLYGNLAANHYGFGIQGSLLQIHSATNVDDIAFGYGGSASFTEHMRIKGSGNVGIGTSSPTTKLHVWTGSSGITPNGSAIITAEGSGTNAYMNVLSTQETGVLFGASGSSANGGLIYNSAAYPNSMMFRTGGNTTRMVIGSTGNVALGNFSATYPLQFPATLGDKICLYDSGATNYGLGVQGNLLQIHSDLNGSDIAFGYGSSSSFTERVRIKGSGEVGIGTSTPTAELEVNGYTKLGSTAPAVKMLKLTGTTAASQGSQATINHGLTSSKILAINILVEYSTGNSVPPSYNASAGYEFDYYVTTSQIIVITKVSNSASILSKPIRILVTYEE